MEKNKKTGDWIDQNMDAIDAMGDLLEKEMAAAGITEGDIAYSDAGYEDLNRADRVVIGTQADKFFEILDIVNRMMEIPGDAQKRCIPLRFDSTDLMTTGSFGAYVSIEYLAPFNANSPKFRQLFLKALNLCDGFLVNSDGKIIKFVFQVFYLWRPKV